MQVAPIKFTSKAPGIKLLNPECEELLSSFAFNCCLRRYIEGRSGLHCHDSRADGDTEHFIAVGMSQQRSRSPCFGPSFSELNGVL